MSTSHRRDRGHHLASRGLVERYASAQVLDALHDTRVVLVMGARQVGKSTLCESIAAHEHPCAAVTLDDRIAREAAEADPRGFLAGYEGPLFIDEVQRVPDLLLAIKQVVDRNDAPGQFLLTGSADILRSRKVHETLAGRMEIVRLSTLAQAEIEGARGNLVDALFRAAPPMFANVPIGRRVFSARAAMGGYPEARCRPDPRRDRWFANYLDTVLSRDIHAVQDPLKASELPRLLSVLASRSSNILRYANLARELGLDEKTIKGYVQLLEAVFVVHIVPSWRPSFLQRALHAPKVHLSDSGLLAHLLGANTHRITSDDKVTGPMLETFVATEIMKLASWSGSDPRIHHYRSPDGAEVDLVLEDRSGHVVAIEVKAAVSLSMRDTAGLQRIRREAGERFSAGVILHPGDRTIALGDRLWAVPLCALWSDAREGERGRVEDGGAT